MVEACSQWPIDAMPGAVHLGATPEFRNIARHRRVGDGELENGETTINQLLKVSAANGGKGVTAG